MNIHKGTRRMGGEGRRPRDCTRGATAELKQKSLDRKTGGKARTMGRLLFCKLKLHNMYLLTHFYVISNYFMYYLIFFRLLCMLNGIWQITGKHKRKNSHFLYIYIKITTINLFDAFPFSPTFSFNYSWHSILFYIIFRCTAQWLGIDTIYRVVPSTWHRTPLL